MAKKVKCAECKYRNEWSIPQAVTERNIVYAEQCLYLIKRTFVCEHSMKTRAREHEQYCKYFLRMTEEEKNLKDDWEKQKIENLEKMIEDFRNGEKDEAD